MEEKNTQPNQNGSAENQTPDTDIHTENQTDNKDNPSPESKNPAENDEASKSKSENSAENDETSNAESENSAENDEASKSKSENSAENDEASKSKSENSAENDETSNAESGIPAENDEISAQSENPGEEELFKFITNDSVSIKREADLAFIDENTRDTDNDPFLNSLENLSENDIQDTSVKKKKSKAQKISDIIRSAVFFASLCVLVVCVFILGKNMIEKKRGQDIYSDIGNQIFSDEFNPEFSSSEKHNGIVPTSSKNSKSEPSLTFSQYLSLKDSGNHINENITAADDEQNKEIALMKARLNSMKNENPDIYGWIFVDGTNISYPLVQYTDNDYYLDHAYNGEYLVVGSIYVDFRCSEDITENFNTVIYGHNITNGTMFNHITKFFKEDVFNNTKVHIYTPDGLFIYEPFAIYESRYDYQYFQTDFASGDDFVKFAGEMHSNSKLQKDMEFSKDDRMITLSTCTNGAYYARYVLQAKLISVIK